MLRVRPSDLQLVVLIVFGPLGAYTGRTNMQVPLLLHRAGIAGFGLGRIADSYLALGAEGKQVHPLIRYSKWQSQESRIQQFQSLASILRVLKGYSAAYKFYSECSNK
jgi:hypothetical protein